MNKPGGYLDFRNQENIARYIWRRHLQGGSSFWRARDLQDLRNDEDRRRWRVIEQKVRETGRGAKAKKVISLAAIRIARARKRKLA
jgi:hypothetical protein